MYALISTWDMSYRGLAAAQAMLAAGGSAGDAAVCAVQDVEADPAWTSVGYGGYPALDGHVRTDAAYMDGNTLRFGAIMSAENIASPVAAARLLCGRQTNCLLAGPGAEEFARGAGLPMKTMLTDGARKAWQQALRERQTAESLGAYSGHDTVCVLALDEAGHMVAATSTSGLFMKENGRVGDSPVIGSGFYCDARYGAAAATGLGEDIMRGCLSYSITMLMKRGAHPEEACREALGELVARKLQLGEDAGSMSVIALSAKGEFGAATTVPFPYVAGTNGPVQVYHAQA